MTHKIFWEDPYLSTLDTCVASVDGAHVTLEATIFYAFSGGQESDAGRIGGQPVLAAQKEGAQIVYTLAPQHGLRPGQPVRVEIDWERRYRLMRLHFAAELVLELACKALPGAEKIGAHIGAGKARIDFAWPDSVAPLLPQLAAQARDIVAADRPIVSAFSDHAAQRRYWEVAGFARVPCGGTHLKRTGEVGALRLKRCNVGRGKERIEIYVD
ncbi:MAG: alanyl-tRNA editing protein [Burkholderiaceae bacterium]